MKARLLVANADAKVAKLLQEYLVWNGYHVEVACSGVDAIEKLRSFEPQLLIMSGQLPWGGSEGVLGLMEEGGHVPRIPVVLIGGPNQGPECTNCRHISGNKSTQAVLAGKTCLHAGSAWRKRGFLLKFDPFMSCSPGEVAAELQSFYSYLEFVTKTSPIAGGCPQ